MDLAFTLDFLADLARHNNKDWMGANKKRYQEAKGHFIELIDKIIRRASEFDKNLEGIDPSKTIFRINRDIRFSKNKDPYKTNFGASIVPGGNKTGYPGYYLHLMPDENFFGGGLYRPEAESMRKIRQEIDYNGKRLRQIIETPTFRKVFEQQYGERLKTAPKGYPKDHPELDLLQLKNHIFLHKVEDKKATSSNYVDQVVEGIRILHPYIKFLRVAIS